MLRSSHDACGCSTQTTSTINLKRSTFTPTKGKPTGRIPHLTPAILVRIQVPQPNLIFRSRMLFVRAYPRETQEMVFDAHDRAFALFKRKLQTRSDLRADSLASPPCASIATPTERS
jgi:hypothetical protein